MIYDETKFLFFLVQSAPEARSIFDNAQVLSVQLSPCTKRKSETKFDWLCMPYARVYKGMELSEYSFD